MASLVVDEDLMEEDTGLDQDWNSLLEENSVHSDWNSLLEENNVHSGWRSLFQEDPELQSLLSDAISKVEKNLIKYKPWIIPERREILLALSRCPPQAIKVIVLSHTPINCRNLATGFAFSCPKGALIDKNVGQRKLPLDRGISLRVLHDVLVAAGYLEQGADYDCCHEVWADKGVLLLNASLTLSSEMHFDMWKEFVFTLICSVNRCSRQERLFVLGWGTNACAVANSTNSDGHKLTTVLESCRKPAQIITEGDHKYINDSSRLVVFLGHHPTFPTGKDNQFARQATNQFRAIRKWYPDLFTLPKLPKQIVAAADPAPETNEQKM